MTNSQSKVVLRTNYPTLAIFRALMVLVQKPTTRSMGGADDISNNNYPLPTWASWLFFSAWWFKATHNLLLSRTRWWVLLVLGHVKFFFYFLSYLIIINWAVVAIAVICFLMAAWSLCTYKGISPLTTAEQHRSTSSDQLTFPHSN